MNSMLNKLMGLPSNDEDYVWVSEFDEEAVRSFYAKFKKLETDPAVKIIPVFINSYGGSTHALSAMRDLIKSSPKPVATIAVGMAMSCGILLLAAGTQNLRFASPNTDMMIHQTWVGSAGGKEADMASFAKAFTKYNENVYRNFAKDANMDYDWLIGEMKDKWNTDWYLNAEEAKALGIIDTVDIPRLLDLSPALTIQRMESYDTMVAREEAQKAEAEKVKKKQSKAKKAVKKRKVK